VSVPGSQRFRGEQPLKFLVRALGPESPRIGYAPLESRTKPWAEEPPIEGWFPLSSGEQIGCDRPRSLVPPRERATLKPSTSLRKPPSRATEKTNAGRQNEIGQRAAEVCLDSLPHRRRFKRPPRAERQGWAGVLAVQATGDGVRERRRGAGEGPTRTWPSTGSRGPFRPIRGAPAEVVQFTPHCPT